jgi:hypothetical protein
MFRENPQQKAAAGLRESATASHMGMTLSPPLIWLAWCK